MKFSKYLSKLDKYMEEKMNSFGDNMESKIGELEDKLEGFGDKVEGKIDGMDDYLGEKIDYMKRGWKKIKPEVRSDIKKGAIGLGVASVTPWYIAIPALFYTYKKASKFLKLKKSYPTKE